MSSLKDKYKKKFNHNEFKKAVDDENKELYSGSDNDQEFHSIKPGVNYFRIFPTTNPAVYYATKKISWLYHESEKKQGEFSRRTVMNAVFHGGLKKDPIEEYIKYVLTTCVPRVEEEEGSKEAAKIKSLFKDFKTTPSPKSSFMAYAYKLESPKDDDREKMKFAIIEFRASVRDGLLKIIDDLEEEEEDTLEFNPISDPEDGYVIKIKYDDKAEKANDYYTVSLTKNKLELDDNDLELMESKENLAELWGKDIYSRKDFDLAIECLSAFEECNKIAQFSTDEEFLEILEEILEDLKKKDKPKSKKSSEPETKKKKKTVVEEDDEEEDDEDEVAAKRLKAKATLANLKKKKAVVEEEDDDEDEDDDDYVPPVKKKADKKVTEKPSKNKKYQEEEEDDEDEDDDDIPSIKSIKKRK